MTSRPVVRSSAPFSIVRGIADRSYFAGRRRSVFFPDALLSSRVESAKCLYRRDLRAHYGCVNAIEFSAGDGHMIASGSELDMWSRNCKRHLIWKVFLCGPSMT